MLIKTVAELRTYIKVDITNEIASITPYVRDAENKYIKEYLGDDLYDTLNTYHNAESPTPDAALDALLPYVQNALAKFTMFLAAPHLDLKIMESGFAVISNTNVAPASKERVQRYMQALETQAYDNIETLIAFLEENKADYDDWTSSTAYTMQTINLVNSATEFNKYVDISKSRLTFRHMRQILANVDELIIKPVVSVAYFTAIIAEIKSGTISAATTAILTDLRRAECYNAIYQYVKMQLGKNTGGSALLSYNDQQAEQYIQTAEHYIAKVKDYMYDNITDYPVFAASDEYDEDRDDTNNLYENDEDNPTFIFGPNYK